MITTRSVLEGWKLDEDDSPAVGPQGPDEQGCVLVDDYHPQVPTTLDNHTTRARSTDSFN